MSDEELIIIISKDKNNSAMAFDEIYNRYSSKVYTYCKKIFRNSTLADDVFQDTFIKFYEVCLSGKQISNSLGFLLKIARNLAINQKKKDQRITTFELEDNIPYFDKEFELDKSGTVLDAALQILPEQFREVIILQEFLNLTYQEIADMLGLSLSIVRIRVFRGKSKLREILKPYMEELK